MRAYLLSIVAVAVFCAICERIVPDNQKAVRFLSGMILIIVLIKPITSVKLKQISSYADEWRNISATLSSSVSRQCLQEQADSIKASTEAYILHEAQQWKLQLQVEVTVSESNPPIPQSVIIRGRASPYAKKKMTEFIADNLGIPKENQLWNA